MSFLAIGSHRHTGSTPCYRQKFESFLKIIVGRPHLAIIARGSSGTCSATAEKVDHDSASANAECCNQTLQCRSVLFSAITKRPDGRKLESVARFWHNASIRCRQPRFHRCCWCFLNRPLAAPVLQRQCIESFEQTSNLPQSQVPVAV